MNGRIALLGESADGVIVSLEPTKPTLWRALLIAVGHAVAMIAGGAAIVARSSG